MIRCVSPLSSRIARIRWYVLTEKRSIFDAGSLGELAGEAGLDPEEVRQVLAGNDYADAVARDIEDARVRGARGVPFFVIDHRYGVSGAQSPDVFGQALAQAWADSHELSSPR